VDISFNSEWLEVPVRRFFKKKTWKVEFAIRAGDLVFELSNLTSPSDKRNFVKELLDGQVVKQEVTTSRSAFDETTKGAGVALQIKPSVATMSLNTQNSVSSKQGQATEQRDIFSLPFVTISAKGHEKEPKWSFMCKGQFLQGSVKCWLADFTIEKIPFGLIAMFRTSFNAILIYQVDSPEYEQTKEKKKAVLHQTFKKFVHKLAERYISKVELSWENHA